MDTEIVKILTPIVTFVLGSLLTLWLKRNESARATTQTSIREVVRLAKDWYVQLHELHLGSPKPNAKSAAASVSAYLQNRLILPDFLFHVAVLRERPRCARLVRAAEEFLASVTDYTPGKARRSNPHDTRCVAVFGDSVPNQVFLEGLDRKLQTVVNEAAQLA